jgi:hypothetical protein
MRSLCALGLAATFACASGSSTVQSTSSAVSKPDARSCAPMVPAIAYRGTDVYAGPDSTGTPIATLKQDTPVCASPDATGFGYRRVKLANGQTGFAADNSLSN